MKGFFFFSAFHRWTKEEMGNEQQGGTSHHFLPTGSQEEQQQQKALWTKNGRIPAGAKSNWQMSRDASMDILSRKTTKLSFKQGEIQSILSLDRHFVR